MKKEQEPFGNQKNENQNSPQFGKSQGSKAGSLLQDSIEIKSSQKDSNEYNLLRHSLDSQNLPNPMVGKSEQSKQSLSS